MNDGKYFLEKTDIIVHEMLGTYYVFNEKDSMLIVEILESKIKREDEKSCVPFHLEDFNSCSAGFLTLAIWTFWFK